MPAEVDNPTIREGINQVVQAILDLIAQGITVNVTNNITESGGGGCGGCGGCSGGTGQIVDDDPDEGQPDEEGEGPGGYPDPEGWGEGPEGDEPFSSYKCQAANYIYQAVYSAINTLGAAGSVVGGITGALYIGNALLAWLVSLGGASIAAGGIVVFALVPGWVLAAMVATIAAVVAAVGVGILLVFAEITEEMAARKNDLICALYKARDTATAQADFSTIMGEVLSDALVGLPPELEDYDTVFNTMFATILPYLLPNKLFNYLFEFDQGVADYEVPEFSSCSCVGSYLLEKFDPLEVGDDACTVVQDGDHYTITPAFVSGRWAAAWHFVNPEDTGEPMCAKMVNITVTGAVHAVYKDNRYECGEFFLEECVSGSFEELEGQCMHAVVFQADPGDPPTIEFDVSEICTV